MKARGFTTLFAKLGLSNRSQRLQVLDALHPAAGLDQVVGLIDQIRSTERCCPRCASPNWHRHGHANDLQRFRCRDCGRTFNDLSGTPLFTAWPRATCPIIRDGTGPSMADELLLPNNRCVLRSASSIAYGDST